MLSAVPTASVSLLPRHDDTVLLRLTYRGRVHELGRLYPATAQRLHRAQSDGVAVPLVLQRPPVVLYWFRDRLYSDTHGLTVEQAEAILTSRHRQREVEKTRALALVRTDSAPPSRYIDAATRAFVFTRDEGRCTVCGSTENLEYDHIIPVTCRGSNQHGNIRLLCLKCNRSSGARMAL